MDLKWMLTREAPKLVTIDTENPEVAVRAELYQRAHKILGYHAPLNRIDAQTSRKQQRAELNQALSAAGIAPFNHGSVRRYMRWQRVRAAFKLRSWDADLGMAFIMIGLLVSCVAQGIFWSLRGGPLSDVPIPRMITSSIAIQVSMIIAAILATNPWHWRSSVLVGYAEFVPDHIVRVALAIKEANPKVYFAVVGLREDRRTWDPFLYAYIPKDSSYHDPTVDVGAYVEVWDEPRYQRRTREE